VQTPLATVTFPNTKHLYQTHPQLPGGRWGWWCGEHWRHSREDGVLINADICIPRQGHEGCHKAGVARQSGLRVVVVGANVLEAIVPIRSGHHSSHNGVWVGLFRVPPPPAPLAVVLHLVLGNGGPSMVNVFWVMAPESHQVAHLPRKLGPQYHPGVSAAFILWQGMQRLRHTEAAEGPHGSTGSCHLFRRVEGMGLPRVLLNDV
ncbi:nucleoside diphosphate-linked moiety X motif 22, partial [Striga asiatica]